MMEQVSSKTDALKWAVAASELLLMNLFMVVMFLFYHQKPINNALVVWNISYMFALLICPPIVQNRLVRTEQMASRVLKCTLLAGTLYYVLLLLLEMDVAQVRFWEACLTALAAFLIVFSSSLFYRLLLKTLRASGRNTESTVFVGAGLNHRALYDSMTEDLSTGYRVMGYFEDKDYSDQFDGNLPRLGTLDEVTDWLETHHVHMLFCNIPSSKSDTILKIMNYCENHLIHFYSVPNVRNYVHHSMKVQFVNDVPVLSLRLEPLRTNSARIVKRAFDIAFSLLVIVGFLWWFTIIVAIITKITMPGPLFFKQKRSGLNGKVFYCLKFRSMAVNENADRVQATANDSRITSWGRIMRKTNIDELPQFFNVLMGDMSLVGPRPHMVLQTDEYGKLIDKYMVRHYAKPGITGLAQVTGSRGETRRLSDMEERIRKDIWYVENWTFMLDIRIICLTVINMLGAEKGNAY